MKTIVRIILLISACYATDGFCFGSSSIAGSHEHAFITTAALSCDSWFESNNIPDPCFERDTMTNLGIGNDGKDVNGPNINYNYKGVASQGFSAVEAPDNLVIHWSGGPDWWHCDNSDYFDSANYPQSRDKATKKLLDCRVWAQRMLGDGFGSKSLWCAPINSLGFTTFRCEGVAAIAKEMLDGSGNVSVRQPNTRSDFTGCDFNGAKGDIKCLVLQQFGYGLHALQDFYSHSNYADLDNPADIISVTNPPGLGRTDLPTLWSLVNPIGTPALLPDQNLSVGCYPNSCANSGRTAHTVLNKDKALIDSYSASVSDINASNNPRGGIVINGVSNSQRAVSMAVRQTRKAWLDLQALIIKKEGPERGKKIICAIASDTPNNCGLTKASLEKMMPQGVEDDGKRKAIFPWVLRDNAILQEGYSSNSQLKSRSHVGNAVGITGANAKDCGTRIIDHHHITFDKQKKLDVHDIKVSGATCNKIVSLLRSTHLAYTDEGAKRDATAPLQCVQMIDKNNFGFGITRILCKNEDESIQVSFFPDCGNNHGECGH
jgi:hypothetical protein